MFWRQLKFAEFDASEMSFSSLMMAKAGGDERWVGLPVFTTRKFFHTGILVRRDAKIVLLLTPPSRAHPTTSAH